jgi:hypothetical protein
MECGIVNSCDYSPDNTFIDQGFVKIGEVANGNWRAMCSFQKLVAGSVEDLEDYRGAS